MSSARGQKREIGLRAAKRALERAFRVPFAEMVKGSPTDLVSERREAQFEAKVFVYPGFKPSGPLGDRFGLMTGVAKDAVAALALHQERSRSSVIVAFVDCVTNDGEVYWAPLGAMTRSLFANLQARTEELPLDFLKLGREPNWLWPVAWFTWREPMLRIEASALDALRDPYTKKGEDRQGKRAEEAHDQKVSAHALELSRKQGGLF